MVNHLATRMKIFQNITSPSDLVKHGKNESAHKAVSEHHERPQDDDPARDSQLREEQLVREPQKFGQQSHYFPCLLLSA